MAFLLLHNYTDFIYVVSNNYWKRVKGGITNMKWKYIAIKDIKILLKDPSALVVLLLLPLMFMIIMSFALKNEYGSNDNPVILGYFDKDNTRASRDYLTKFEESEDFL